MTDDSAKRQILERALQLASDGVRIEGADGETLFDSLRFEARRAIVDQPIPDGGMELSLPGDDIIRLTEHPLDGGGRIVVARDVSDIRKAQDELTELSMTDALTGSCNWLSAERRGAEAVETYRRYDRPVTIMRFDVVNLYSLEHREHREAVIKHVNRVAGHTLRVVDMLARIEDGRFVAIMPETDLPEAREAGVRICERLSKSGLQHAGTAIEAEVCAGVASLRDKDTDFEGLVAIAEEALEQAKATGPNSVACRPE